MYRLHLTIRGLNGTGPNNNKVYLYNNFPDRLNDTENEIREPEVAGYMAFVDGRDFVLSASIQSGDLVVRYPYDQNPEHLLEYTPTPDDTLFRTIAQTYSMNQYVL